MYQLTGIPLHTRLTLRYALVLGVVALLTLASYVFMENAIGTEVLGAKLLNLAGRQRMLCQRVETLTLRILRQEGHNRAAGLDELERVVQELGAGHDELVHGPPSGLGLAPGNPALGLLRENVQGSEELMHEFIDEAGGLRAALAGGCGEAEAERRATILGLAGDALLVDLDGRMSKLQRLGEDTMQRLSALVMVLLGAALAGLLLTGLLVFRPMVAEVVRDREHLESLNRSLETQAGTDKLTGAYNRRTWDVEIRREFSKARRQEQRLCLVMTDLDHFKRVNDEFGHQRGDNVLKEFTSRMKQAVRASDTVYRLGGEEFAVLLPGTDIEKGRMTAEKLRLAVADQALDGLAITASFGVAETDGDESPDEFFRRADQALYAAKAGGRNRVESAVKNA